MTELPTVKAVPQRLDVKPAIVELDSGVKGVHFELSTGQSFTLSVVAMHNILRISECNDSSGLVQVRPRDERLIGAGVVYSDEYPLLEQEPTK